MVREVLDGKIFGDWKVLGYAGNKKQLCQCSCGEIREVSTYSLTSGKSKNCGSKSKHPVAGQKEFRDITNKQFGELTAISYVGDTNWECRCQKGHSVIKSWKKLSPDSKCPMCKRDETLKKQSEAEKLREQARQEREAKASLIGHKVNDLTVIAKLQNDRWLCRCICGAEREVRGYNLRHPPTITSYKCNHTDIIGKRFGKLKVIRRLPNQTCDCLCDCGNSVNVFIGNLLNNSTTSCGCNKAPLYSKEDVVNILKSYISTHGEKPFARDLSDILGIGMTAAYSYINNYDLRQYINPNYGSRAERDIVNILKEKYAVQVHNREILGGIELDIFIPEIKTAIEFNGNYWHSYPNKDKGYHQRKTLECIKKGIRLIHIFEYEWENKNYRGKIEGLLNSIMGLDTKLYARSLGVTEIPGDLAAKFEADNHLQGKATGSINIALVDKGNNIFGLMSFGKPRFDTQYEYELIRLCYRIGYGIIGGAEKMFKYFIEKYKPSSVLTYCSLAKFTGAVYNRLGFSIVKRNPITEPNYVWVDAHSVEVLSRYKTIKKDLVGKGFGTEEMTEDEIMMSRNFLKIYDSGNIKYEYIRQQEV